VGTYLELEHELHREMWVHNCELSGKYLLKRQILSNGSIH
jgi:hypothetical protein